MTTEAQVMTPRSEQAPPADDETRVYVASQWQLTWWRFKKHRVAYFSGIVVILIYLVAAFAEFLMPFPTYVYNAQYTYAPPQRLRFFQEVDGSRRFRPYVYGYSVEIDPVALRRTFVVDPEVQYEVGFFVEGFEYKVLGLIPANRHLIGPKNPEDPMYLLGADRLGRDVFSRLIAGTRISMSIGLVGVFLSLILGILLGGISGLYGGVVDNLIQRLIEFMRSIPTIPLWLGLAAAMPATWPPLRIYFGITIILSLVGWTSLARVVRGRFLTLRTEDS
jgi:peptide/nickel transport system permease protein